MKIVVRIYSCYKKTYTPIVQDVIDRLYGCNTRFTLCIDDISKNNSLNIQQQRNIKEYVTRTIRVYEDNVLKHIIGLSNTNYDEDRHYEFINGKSNKKVDSYGQHNYHANTYLLQGIPDIFLYYFNNSATADLSFYLLDKGQSYVSNLFNILSYRELQTIGFRILNLDIVNFTVYNNSCNTILNGQNITFPSFNKFLNDIAYISERNTGNNPSYIQCQEYEKEGTYITEKYIYTLKALSAQAYDSMIRVWCLKKLADREGTEIEFKIGKQYFSFSAPEQSISNSLTGPVIDVLKKAGIEIHFETDEEFLNERTKLQDVYLKHKSDNNYRNQTLFRNNLRKKGIPIKCSACGDENASILDAAHIWEVNQIAGSSAKEINSFISENNLFDLLDSSSKYYNEIFYKKYCLTNSGDNGIWLCKNHHKLFDGNYYCFDSNNGRIVLKFNSAAEALEFKNTILSDCALSKEIMTDATKAFLCKRQLVFSA